MTADSRPGRRFRTAILASILAVSLILVLAGRHNLFAAAGACAAPSTDYGTVTSTASVSGTGTYRVWSRMTQPSPASASNTYMLEIDGSSCYTIGGATLPTYASGATTFFASGTANWTAKTSAGTYIDVSLTAGTHTFKLIGNADGVVVDRLVLTQDTACQPTGAGDNCANPPDTTKPVVAITSPATGAKLSSTTTITANATDDVAVQKVEFFVDNSLKGTDTTGSSGNYTYSLDPSTLTVGTHTLTATAYDTSGNTTTSSNVSITVPDTTPPTITLSSPTAGATVSGTMSVTGSASDSYAFDSANLHIDGAYIANSTTAGAYSFPVDTTKLSNGAHTLYVRAYDAAGNQTDTATISFTVSNQTSPPPDTTPPTVSMATPANGAVINGSYNVSANISDASGIKQAQFYVDGVLKSTDTSAPFSFTLDTTTLSNASHTFKVVATDNSTNQNTATSATVTATVSNLGGDINLDGKVDIQDFGLFKKDFGRSGTPGSLGRSDINQNGVVDIQDFGLFKNNFGK